MNKLASITLAGLFAMSSYKGEAILKHLDFCTRLETRGSSVLNELDAVARDRAMKGCPAILRWAKDHIERIQLTK